MSQGKSLFWFAASRPVAITMLVAAAVVFGFVGLSRLPVNLLPEITHPVVTIRTEYPGTSPQDVEERVSERIQEQVSVTSGVQRVVSVSRPGVSDVILTFAWGTKMVFAVSDIRERLDRVYLPTGAERPLVLRYDPSLDPVVTLGLTGGLTMVELRRIAEEDLERELSEIEGVAAVKIRGGEEEEIRIAVDEKALTLYGLDISLIGRRLAAENLNQAAGVVEEAKTEYLVRALNEFEDLQQIEDVILVRRDEVSIRLGDVATVSRVPKDREVISRVDGQPCVLIDVYKEANANIVDLCEQLRNRVFGSTAQQMYSAAGRHLGDVEPAPYTGTDAAERTAVQLARARAMTERRSMVNYLAYQLRDSKVSLDLLQDQSQFISESINDVTSSAVWGGLFAILVIYLFLRRFRATAILFVSIPVSLVATFAPMFMSGIDLNIMSLGGLALGVGMLVDNSIVVLESITRAREEGEDRQRSAVLGVSRVAGAVIASTLTTVAVFFPIVFVEGVAGQLFKDQALTVVFALLMSLLAALFVIPMLAARDEEELVSLAGGILVLPMLEATRGGQYEKSAPSPPRSFVGRITQRILVAVLAAALWTGRSLWLVLRTLLWPFTKAFDFSYSAIAAVYPGLVRIALRRRGPILITATALFALAVWRTGKLGNEMLPEVRQGEFYLESFLPRDATVERNDEVMREVEAEIKALAPVRSTFLAAGVDKKELNDSDEGEHSSQILIRLIDADDRFAQEEAVRNQIREIMRRHPEVQSFRFARPSILAFNAPVVVEVYGRDVYQLRLACGDVRDAMAQVPGLRDVRSTLQRGNPEISIRFDRDKMAALELDSQVVTQMLQNKVQGDVPTLFAERERKIDMMVRLDRSGLHSVSQLLAVNVNPTGIPAIPLESIATVHRQEGPSEIRRIGNLRGAEVRGTLSGFDLGHTQELLELALTTLTLPEGITARIGGQKEEKDESLQSLMMALLLAVFLVYIVMASQFENLVQPFVILLTLPLAMVGVIFVLELLAIPLSVIVFLGAIVLAGIVVNNAIILIDQINQLRQDGIAKLEAIVEGAKLRLRPVLMTTVTTVLGLLPLTGWLWGGEGLELRAPMAIVVITGLTVSTLLTLIVIPVVYSLSDRKT